MAQQNDLDVFPAAVRPDMMSGDRTPDPVAIFSAPGVAVVFHWWAESNRRWAERNGSQTLGVHPVVPHFSGRAISVGSDPD